MKLIYRTKKTKNFICTILIGGNYESEWNKYSKSNWLKYCKKNNIGLIIFNKNLISKKNKYFKTPHWQKLLIGNFLIKKKIKASNICFLDSDILVNYVDAPDIFKFHHSSKIGIVSKFKKLPFDLLKCKKTVAFFRKKYINKKYPLDSSLFMNIQSIYKYIGLPSQKNYASTGVFLFNIKRHSNLLYQWYFKYTDKKKEKKLSFEEIFLNYEIQSNKLDQWLDYKFQAIWTYEMAINYPFLYKNNNRKLIRDCINHALSRNYFMHFPGKWNEAKMWKSQRLFDKEYSQEQIKFKKYLLIKPSGKPKGFVPLKNNSK